MTMAHSFPQAAEFQDKQQNLPFTMEFPCLWNSAQFDKMTNVITFWHIFADKKDSDSKSLMAHPVVFVKVNLSFSIPLSAVPEPVNWPF